MFWLVEKIEQLKEFYSKGYKEAFIEIIPFNDNYHPALNNISLIYIKPIVQKTKGYLIAINHSETLSIKLSHIEKILKSYDKLFTRNQKQLLYHFPFRNIIDISFNGTEYKIPTTTAHNFYYQKYPTKQDINKIIPVTKHYERCEAIYDIFKEATKQDEINPYYSRLSKVFFNVEKNGIKTVRRIFDKFYDPIEIAQFYKDNTIYTQYNLHTLTGRPSNSFNGINFGALPKDNGNRKAFIPHNDKFINIDISAFHPTLASQLIKYKWSSEAGIYQEFANHENITVDEAKIRVFQNLYGSINNEHPFFIQIQEYINKLWKQFNDEGFIEVPISGVKFYKNKLADMNPNKLFNWLIQALETACNVEILWDISRILKNKNTKVVLYVYDSFLIDLDEAEEEIMEDIYKVFEKYNLKFKIKEGQNYGF